MAPGQILLRVTVIFLVFMVVAAEDDLADFDFTDFKEIDWAYDNNILKEQSDVSTEGEQLVKFDELEEDNQVRPFDYREKILRAALSKALTNSALRQKFVEVIPILRVLSSQQRLALSALISSQINAKTDHGLNLEQVRVMFGNDKKLLLPIVYDIANLVQTSARKYLNNDFNAPLTARKQQSVFNRRVDNLSAAELAEEENDKNISNQPISIGQDNNEFHLEDFFSETGEEILDPKSINEELQKDVGKTNESKLNITSSPSGTQRDLKRSKRSVAEPAFVHKLIRSVPLSINGEDIDHNENPNTVKLNKSGFLSPTDLTTDSINTSVDIAVKHLSSNQSTPLTKDKFKYTQSYQKVEDAAFASFNETVVDFQNSSESLIADNTADEPLPKPEELTSGPRYRISNNRIHSSRPNGLPMKRKRIQVPRIRTKIATKGIGEAGNGVESSKKCERFTSSMCIRTDDYPLDQIMGSIRRHKNAMIALWADYQDKSSQLDMSEDFNEFAIRRREDDATGGGMCQSIVRYARPQKARSASGDWKYIVNTGKHTQTLRLEKCTAPQDSCSYLAQSYRSHCAQIYNYHRLLSWDKTRGLHVDIFKVPTCCSCQVDGFRQQFPPLAKDFTPAYNSDIYSTINEELDYNDELDEDDLSYQAHNGFKGKHKKHDTGYNDNELLQGSQSVQTKLHSPNPTLGSYLKPPGGEQQYEGFDYKLQQRRQIGKSAGTSSVSHGKLIADSSRRRPYKSLGSANMYNEARVDLDFSPSEQHQEKEVNFSGGSLANPNKRVQQKRQRIHSVPHTANPSTSSTIPEREGSSIPNNFYMAPGFGTPESMAGIYEDSGNRDHVATNAHQASAPIFNPHSNIQKQSNVSNNFDSSHKTRPLFSRSGKNPKTRFRSAPTTTTATFITTTVTKAPPPQAGPSNQWSIFQPQPPAAAQPTHITSIHMNSIYSPVHNKSTKNVNSNIHTLENYSDDSERNAPDPGTKRINYSYHPIIDFFETHKYLTSDTLTVSNSTQNNNIENENPFPHRITKYQASTPSKMYGMHQSHERRIGFSIGGSVNSTNNFPSSDNSWHPVIVERK